MTTATTTFDQTRAEAFGDRMLEILNGGALATLTSVGHRTGLFDTLAGLPPSTSDEIARAAGLNERYVREWLGGMVVGEIVTYDPAAETYELPDEHAASLTRDAAPNNLAAFTQYIGLAGTVEDGIVESFRNGGGVPYSGFPRFQEVMVEDSGQTVLPALLDHIVPLVPGLPAALERGIDVLDIGCGSGKALNLLARTYPASRFTGYDISEQGLATARADAAAQGLTNITFAVQDVSSLPDHDRFDLVTAFDAIHDQANPAAVLRGIQAALKPGGTFLMQDIAGSSRLENNVDHPLGPLLYAVSVFHCMTVSLAEGGAGLGTMWGRELAEEMLTEAGFGSIDVRQLAHDVQNNYFVITKQS